MIHLLKIKTADSELSGNVTSVTRTFKQGWNEMGMRPVIHVVAAYYRIA